MQFFCSFSIIPSLTVIFLVASLSITQIIPQDAFAHGVPNWEKQAQVIRFEDERFSRQSLQTGEFIKITGTLIGFNSITISNEISLYSETSNLCNYWEVISIEPVGSIGLIPPDSAVSYEMFIRSTTAGVYHLHTMVNVQGFGQVLGPGQTVVVEGEPLSKFCDSNILSLITIGTVISMGVLVGIIFILKRKKSPTDDTDFVLNDKKNTDKQITMSDTKTTRRCKVCDTNIPDGEKVCPGCGDIYS